LVLGNTSFVVRNAWRHTWQRKMSLRLNDSDCHIPEINFLFARVAKVNDIQVS
jgi:hypothetical protein